MPYLLRAQVVGAAPEIPLTAEEFADLHQAHLALTAGLALEGKFEILLSNYLELEKEVLGLAAEQMVRGEISYERMAVAHRAINRQLINLLTTARLYVDHLPHHTNEITGKARQAEVEALLNAEYDTHFFYRFMEALRNYVQHRGFPAHGLSFPGNRVEGKRRDFVFSVEFSASKQRLADDDKFKRSVLNESPDSIDLKAACRFYVECLGRVHLAARAMTTPVLDEARNLVEAAMQRYEVAYGRKPTGLAALERSDQGKIERAVPLLLDWDRTRLDLIKRNRDLVNLRDRCVTSAILPPEE